MNTWSTSPFTARFTPTKGNAWLLVVLGALAVVAGLAALVFPGVTLFSLILIFGWFAIVSGVVQIFHAFSAPTTVGGKVLVGLLGLVTVALGIWALVLPGATLGAFILLLAAFFFISGVLQIVAAFRGHMHISMLLWGILGIIVGVIALAYPGAAALTIAILFGVYAILGGIGAISGGVQILRHPSESAARFNRFDARVS
jgi:uncharacterized membrane protein HdeD (DUF308 family)